MKTSFFDGSLDVPPRDSGRAIQGLVSIAEAGVSASVHLYAGSGLGGETLARITTGRLVEVKWMDRFEFRSGDGGLRGRGLVLFPGSPPEKKMAPTKRRILLERLSKGEKEMILVLAEEKGIRGLNQEEIVDFCGLGEVRIGSLARALEEDDAVRILSFCPLFLVSQSALNILRVKVMDFLTRYHEKHPDERGVGTEKLAARFGPPEKALSLVLRALEKSGMVKAEGGLVWLADFRVPLGPEDEEVLGRLEAILYKGEFAAASLEGIRRELGLSERRLQTLLSVLMERKKIVKGKDGFLLHSRWLEDLVGAIRRSGKRELSVADFKAMTGLSRKYAIPLLEFLDELGVTRRKGSSREIL